MALVSLPASPRIGVGRILLHAARGQGAAAFWPANDGIVFAGRTGARAVDARRRAGSDQPLAIDEERYLAYCDGQLTLTDHSLLAAQAQSHRKVAFYLAPTAACRTLADVRLNLDAGERFLEAVDAQPHPAPGYVPVVVRPEFRRALLDDVCAELADRRLPIAFMFASPFDPLGTASDVNAALRLAATVRDAIALRLDLSAIGLVAAGLRLGAIGATPDLRHVYIPMRRRDPTAARDDSAHVYIPALGAWMRGSQLAYLDETIDLFACNCSICDGDTVLRFAESGRCDDELRQLAEAHAALAWRDLAAGILEGEEGTRFGAWLDRCAAALRNFGELRSYGIELTPPGYLAAWTSIR